MGAADRWVYVNKRSVKRPKAHRAVPFASEGAVQYGPRWKPACGTVVDRRCLEVGYGTIPMDRCTRCYPETS